MQKETTQADGENKEINKIFSHVHSIKVKVPMMLDPEQTVV